jgi:tRNA-dihydrouridine synthase B
MARKHLGWYSSGMPSSAEFRSKINRLSDPMAVEQLVVDFYQAQMVAACQEKILT